MNPVLLLPAGLAALAALVLPLVIHIARRSDQRPTDFAALRWLSERPRPRARLRLDELALLGLRLLLLGLVALYLARPALPGLTSARDPVVVIPGADPTRSGLAPADLAAARWLAPGFPRVSQGTVGAAQPVASLLRELDAAVPPGARLTLVAPAIVQGGDGERPRLAHPVRWIITPGAMAERPAAAAPVPRVALRHDGDHAGEARYLRAALAAIAPQDGARDVAGLAAPLPAPSRVLIRLAGGSLPQPVGQFVRSGGTVLVSADATLPAGTGPAIVLWSAAAGEPLVEARGLGGGRVLRFTRALRPADMPALLDSDFPLRLRAVLAPLAPAPARVMARDLVPLPGGASGYAPPLTDLRPWLALLIVVVLLIERWLATRRIRAPGP